MSVSKHVVAILLAANWLNVTWAPAVAQNKVAAPKTHLHTSNPYYPDVNFPALTTPDWIGEDGVDAVVVLAIDDMRDPQKYEAYLRPILQRLKQIDGRAPVSIMTNQVKADDPQLQSWLDEGLSIDVHTVDHPCPLLKDGDFAKSKSTVDRCIDALNMIPGNKPVAFRMPCCDSLNTPSPRFFAEIFSKPTANNHFLQIDSSVFNFFTSNDPAIPRPLVVDSDGRDKFLKYMPKDRGFVNFIENYPYPYVINGTCWQFPCVAPSDWSAQHRHKINNPVTVNDWKAALDITVVKKGVFCLVFHPHGWIRNDQIVELIDHAVTTHGTKVKFLNFKEAANRLNHNVLKADSLRTPGALQRVVDLLDTKTRVDSSGQSTGKSTSKGLRSLTLANPPAKLPNALKAFAHATRYVDLNEDGHDDIVMADSIRYEVRLFDSKSGRWAEPILSGKTGAADANALWPIVLKDGSDNGFFVHSRSLCWQNENTNKLPHLVYRVNFDDILKGQPVAARDQAAALQSITVREGLTVDLVAAEPLTQDPVAFDWGYDGCLWVAEMSDYPNGVDGKGTPGGRIRRLTDKDGDGTYDHSDLFLADVPFPNGVVAWKKGVLVSAAPDVFYAEDSDGDGKADKREVLFTGFVEGNQQHRANGFSYGLDDWIYIANGDSNGKVKSIKTGEVVDISGRDVRIRPATGEIQAIAGRTQFGRNRDDVGNWFGCNNSRPMFHFVLDEHYLRRNERLKAPDARNYVPEIPGNSPVFPLSVTVERFNDFHTANRITSACSTRVFRDVAMGQQFYGNSFTCEPVHNLVSRAIMTQQGVSFVSRRATDETDREFLASTDNWFRPVFCRTGPNGSLWVADMYRQTIEHPEWIPPNWQKRLDLRNGHDKGRIYRVRAVNQKPVAAPNLAAMSHRELVLQLSHRNGWRRDMAQRLLVERNATDVAGQLTAMTASKFDLARMSALCTLDTLNQLQPAHVIKALDDESSVVRRHAVRLSERFAKPDKIDVRKKLLALSNDSDAQVRLQLAYTLGEFSDTGQVLASLLAESDNKYLTAAALSSLNPSNLVVVLDGLMEHPAAPDAAVIQTVAGYAGSLASQSLTSSRLDSLRQNQYARTCQALCAIDNVGRSPAITIPRDSEFNRLHKACLADRALKTFTQADREWGIRWACTQFRAKESRSPSAVGDSTIAKFYGQWFTPETSINEQLVCVNEIGRLGTEAAAGLLLQQWRSATPSVRVLILDQLLSRDQWIELTLAAIEAGKLPASEIDATRRQQLVTHRNDSIRLKATSVLKLTINADRQKVIDQHADVLAMTGDSKAGRTIFEKRCATCHQLDGLGKNVGPNLASLTDRSAKAILTAILDPNRAVEAKYIAYTAVTEAGRTHSGLITNESGNSITLRATDGKDVSLLRADLDELQSSRKSFMPEGLEKDLTHQNIADVIQFVRSATGADQPKSFPGNSPELVTANADGILRLTARNCQILGPTIRFENYHGNLGFWAGTADRAVWNVKVRKAGKYRVRLHYACDPPTANNAFALRIGGAQIKHSVAATDNWDTYRFVDVGTVTLANGQTIAELRPAGKPQSYLMDLKELQLTLVE